MLDSVLIVVLLIIVGGVLLSSFMLNAKINDLPKAVPAATAVNGKDGVDGVDGADGINGSQGESVSRLSNERTDVVLAAGDAYEVANAENTILAPLTVTTSDVGTWSNGDGVTFKFNTSSLLGGRGFRLEAYDEETNTTWTGNWFINGIQEDDPSPMEVTAKFLRSNTSFTYTEFYASIVGVAGDGTRYSEVTSLVFNDMPRSGTFELRIKTDGGFNGGYDDTSYTSLEYFEVRESITVTA